MKKLAEEKDLELASARKEIETLKDRLDLYKKSMAKYEAQIQTEDEIGKFILQVMNDIKLGYWKEKEKKLERKNIRKEGSTNDLLASSGGQSGGQSQSGGGGGGHHHSKSSPSLNCSPSPAVNASNNTSSPTTSPTTHHLTSSSGDAIPGGEEEAFTLPPIHHHVSYKQRLAEFRKKTEKY
ncbi:hypothetical protein FDP41_007041 [Naegleria fowleri]|uniref:Uncharacterized protein n=1 Tax=Naegleria fowleri TaxID=5763 RepID=A0A6A5B9F9_NAEFO|nr:uncharacterized protein FDP41_007041 [Naegleria fowleri]KAF0973957.1 hypothetical protein FDP41_007041 [Naegleria fowleri]